MRWDKRILLFIMMLLAAICCKNNDHFDKTRYLVSCGLSTDKMLLSDSEEDSLHLIVFDSINSPNSHYRNELIHDGNVQSCKSLLLEYASRSFFQHSRNDSVLFAHYYAYGISKSNSPYEVVDLTLSYAKGRNSTIKKNVGKASFPIAKSINDTLALQSISLIVSGIKGYDYKSYLGSDKHAISDEDARELLYWSDSGLQYARSLYGSDSSIYRDMLEDMAYCSWKLGSSHYIAYTDSLLALFLKNGKQAFSIGNDFEGVVYSRYIELLKEKNYSQAERILDYYCPSFEGIDSVYIPLKNLLPDRPRGDYREPVLPDSTNYVASLIDHNLYTSLLSIFNKGHVNLWAFCFFEKARLRYLSQDGPSTPWLNRAFYEGVSSTFPATAWVFIDDYLRSSYQHNQGLMDLLALQYNNDNPCSIYDALLFIKGASESIPPSIYKHIKDNSPHSITEYVDSIRTYGIASRDGWERNFLENEIGPNVKALLNNTISSYSDVKEHLSSDDVAIEFYAVPSFDLNNEFVYRAAILTSDFDEPRIVDLCSSKLLKHTILNKGLYNNLDAYHLIWEPIEKLVHDKKTVYFSMDRLLNLLNLQALLTPDGNRLGQEYRLVQLSSTREILSLFDSGQYESIALFGGIDYRNRNSASSDDNRPLNQNIINRSVLRSFHRDSFRPLPYSKHEIDDISRYANDKGIEVLYYSSSDGTEDAFKRLSGEKISILHVATHGFYYSAGQSKEIDYLNLLNGQDNPLERCGLLFAGSRDTWQHPHQTREKEDGVLLGEEIAKLDFSNVDLVVLSACKSALGDIDSEGVSGLRQAFKRAGAKSILITLSNVDDKAASFFMKSFYGRLFMAKDKYEAFDFAVNQMKSTAEFSSPSYWAPFVLID